MNNDSYVDCLKKVVLLGFNPMLNKLQKKLDKEKKRRTALENVFIRDRGYYFIKCDNCNTHIDFPIVAMYYCSACGSYVFYDFCEIGCFDDAIKNPDCPIKPIKECKSDLCLQTHLRLLDEYSGNDKKYNEYKDTNKLIRLVKIDTDIDEIDTPTQEYEDLGIGDLYQHIAFEDLSTKKYFKK